MHLHVQTRIAKALNTNQAVGRMDWDEAHVFTKVPTRAYKINITQKLGPLTDVDDSPLDSFAACVIIIINFICICNV